MCFDVGQKVIVNCKDEDYLDDRGIKNGDCGIITRISTNTDYPIHVDIVDGNCTINCLFKSDELRPFKNKAKIL